MLKFGFLLWIRFHKLFLSIHCHQFCFINSVSWIRFHKLICEFGNIQKVRTNSHDFVLVHFCEISVMLRMACTVKFGVRGNFNLLTSNLNSKTKYQFEILRKSHFSSLRSWFLAQHSLINWLPWQHWMTCLQSFNSKGCYRWLPKVT